MNDREVRDAVDAIGQLPLTERAAAFGELHERLGALLDDDSGDRAAAEAAADASGPDGSAPGGTTSDG